MPTAEKWGHDRELEYIRELIARIVRECPRRQPTSEDERKAHLIMKAEFEALGLPVEEQPFEFNDNLYKNLVLHFGLGWLGTVVGGVSPLAGLLLHLVPTASYWADSTRKGYFLRRLLKFKPSRNVVATMKAEGEPKLRIVILAHADAAFTGIIFNPWVIKTFVNPDVPVWMEYFKKSLGLATRTQGLLAGFDLLRLALGPIVTWPLRPIEQVLTIPSLLAFVGNLAMVMRDEIVPGANDDLSGVAAIPLLVRRLAEGKRPEVEYVFGITGCEEASLGGGDAMAERMEGTWDKRNTVILGLDGISGGDLRFLEIEGEVWRTPVPKWLGNLVRETAATEPRFKEVTGFEVPVGGSDVAAFLARGWDGVCLACVDPLLGTPRHYHQPTDTPENLDHEKVLYSTDFAEKLVRAIESHRLGPAPVAETKPTKGGRRTRSGTAPDPLGTFRRPSASR
jgi:hypothetical protein